MLRSRSLEHEDTLRSIAGDVAAKLAGATDASAERGAGIHMDRERDQPHRNGSTTVAHTLCGLKSGACAGAGVRWGLA